MVAEMPNSSASFYFGPAEVRDRGDRRDYRIFHTGVTGPVDVSASRGEARRRMADFQAEL